MTPPSVATLLETRISLLFSGNLPEIKVIGKVSKASLLNPAIKRYGLSGFLLPSSVA
ncbi:hypothetical protein [Clostridioides difficile]|uniref:hypothetical protein n=1 Tax=Clostridioides difficile TaxID=1496 RepID=UPI002E8DD4F6|nr:hypothetical protein [Clostridioides difficile]